MTSFSLSDFKNQIARAGGLSRSHLFRCTINFHADAPLVLKNYPGSRTRAIVCKAAKVPEFKINSTELHYMTRPIHVPGGRTHSAFSSTFFSTNDYNTYNLFTTWQGLFNSFHNNRRGFIDSSVGIGDYVQEVEVTTNPSSLYADITLEHFSPESTGIGILESIPLLNLLLPGDNTKIATYRLKNAYPTSIGGLSFSHDDSDQFQSYDVEFNYLDIEYFTHTPKNLLERIF